MQSWSPKDPDEVLDYHVVWDDRLDADEQIASFEFFLDSGVVTIDSIGQADKTCTVWLSGGVIGDVNIITNRITTDQGRVYDQSARLRIRSR